MQIISGTVNFQINEPTAVVIGKFDGIHLGHLYLLTVLMMQKEQGLKTVVFTFDKSPASLFGQEGDTYRELCTAEEKRAIFESIGIDVLIEFPMNPETAAIPAKEFITEILHKQLRCNKLIAGEDITFGHKGRGDSNLLMQYSEECGYQVEILEKVSMNPLYPEEAPAEEISSTAIRKAINAGNIAKVSKMLGRPYSVEGEVIHGRQLAGGLLEMPTANVKWPENKVIPAFGVYFTEITVDGKCYHGITNVGKKPTVNESSEREVLAESYLYDFQGELYGRQILIEFYKFVRPEQKFENLDALKEQMQRDMSAGKNYWK